MGNTVIVIIFKTVLTENKFRNYTTWWYWGKYQKFTDLF